jgi:hypothetical protein
MESDARAAARFYGMAGMIHFAVIRVGFPSRAPVREAHAFVFERGRIFDQARRRPPWPDIGLAACQALTAS